MSVIGDLYDIETRLQEMDPGISLDFNHGNGNYAVFHKGFFVMWWPRPLDARLIQHMRKIDLRRGYDPLKEIDSTNERIDQSMEKARQNHLEDSIKEYFPYIRDEIDGVKSRRVF